MARYIIKLERDVTIIETAEIEVEADNEDEAIDKVFPTAGRDDIDWNEDDVSDSRSGPARIADIIEIEDPDEIITEE